VLIPYPGEKSSIANFISPRIPEGIDSYIEPFSGMFGVYFSLRFSKMKASRNVYSDPDPLNCMLFDAMRNSPEFIKEVKNIRICEDRLNLAKSRVSDDSYDRKAVEHLISLCCGERWTSRLEFEVFKMKFSAYKYHIDGISEIMCCGWEESIRKNDSKKSFFYINPPISQSDEEHIRMASSISTMEGKAILSTSPFDGARRIYSGFRIESIWTICGEELLISNQ